MKDSGGEQERRIAAKRDLKAGLVLTVHDLTVALGQNNPSINHESFSEQELHQIIGSRLLQDVSSGTLILKSQIQMRNSLHFSHRVPKGMRAFLIRTQTRLPLEPGDHVDLLGKKRGGDMSPQLLVEDKKVLAVNRKEDHEELLVALSLQDIGKIGSDNENPWVDVVLRNPLDSSKDLRKIQRSKPVPKHKIQIMEEGNG